MPSRSLITTKAGDAEVSVEAMLFDGHSCGIIMVDRAGVIIAQNPEAQRVLGLPAFAPQTTDRPLPSALVALLGEVRQTGKPATYRHVVLEGLEKNPTTLSVTALPVSDSLGGSVILLLNDRPATARLDHHLRRLDRLARVGTLSACLAHEIKNALVTIKTFAELLLEKNTESELSETVRREIDRMDVLVTHMLRFAAPPHPVLAPLHLHALLELSLVMIQPRLNTKLIVLERQFHAPDDWIIGDSSQLEQVFLNLLFNALDALGEEGTLSLSTELVETTGGKQIWVRITDTGSGICAADLGRIFEPFFTTKPRGSGLGLAVTRHIIEEHRGEIRVESQPGKGTTFILLLPSVKAPAGA